MGTTAVSVSESAAIGKERKPFMALRASKCRENTRASLGRDDESAPCQLSLAVCEPLPREWRFSFEQRNALKVDVRRKGPSAYQFVMHREQNYFSIVMNEQKPVPSFSRQILEEWDDGHLESAAE